MIFGTQSAKIKYNNDTELVLNSSVVKYEWNKTINNIEHKDVFTGDIVNEFNAAYSEFEVIVYLWKYNEFPLKVALWNELYSLLFAEIDEFYPHADGNAVKDRDGNAVKYFVESVEAGQLDKDTNHLDIITVKFVPTNANECGRSIVGE